MDAISVSELNNQIKSLLEATFIKVSVRGEVSNLTYHRSGHVYFSIKDKESSIKCVMFKGNASKLKFKIEEGRSFIVEGAISVYVPRGDYQINAFLITPDGEGALALAFNQLKEKLQKKGYFEPTSKKKIPKFIDSIAIVTSSTGAALQDMLRVAQKRWPLIKIKVINSLTQGEGAKESIVSGIRLADSLGVDVVVVGRGGGSIEDLWCFNEEIVADAIFSAKTPVVSAVGHEIDVLISDFVADLRAPTPSAAMELILPDKFEIMQYLDILEESFDKGLKNFLHKKEQILEELKERYKKESFEYKMSKDGEKIDELKIMFEAKIEQLFSKKELELQFLKERIDNSMQNFLNKKDYEFENIFAIFKQSDPSKKLESGFVKVGRKGKLKGLERIKIDDILTLEDGKKIATAKVLNLSKPTQKVDKPNSNTKNTKSLL